jgi:shikimate kinase
MRRILLTGMSGVGKTTVLEALAHLGHRTVETDVGGWKVPGPDGALIWDEARINELLTSSQSSLESGQALFVSGTVENQGRFYSQFDVVLLLSAPQPVMIERLQQRTNNPYGKRPGELDEILGYVQSVEPLLRRRATAEIRTDRPLVDVVADVLRLSGLPPA